MYFNEYSPSEWKIIRHYGLADIASGIDPAMLYQMLAKKAFVENDGSKYEHALRQAVVALDNRSPYRMIPEWDDLVRVD